MNFDHYAKTNKPGNWEIEHSKPRAKGGTDHLNNLYAACINCNRSKQAASNSRARAKHGHRRAPYSRKEKIGNAITYGAIGVLGWIFIPPPVRIAGTLICTVAAAKIGYDYEPE